MCSGLGVSIRFLCPLKKIKRQEKSWAKSSREEISNSADKIRSWRKTFSRGKEAHRYSRHTEKWEKRTPPKAEEISKDPKIWCFLWGCLLKSLKFLVCDRKCKCRTKDFSYLITSRSVYNFCMAHVKLDV